jgi:acyl-CoA thioesterase-2
MFDKDVQLASLDQALWLHRPFRADEWLLYAMDSPSATARAASVAAASTRETVLWSHPWPRKA